ncbi:hypothetical protein F5148DRAFT_1170150 [Russula earlei]|uniref:Uncharacterized protein n=1 Tax=Russula earlei TaxID=71964 RepID=A0ACC0UKI3_9AGAM|nr:hypothetical protein F5148DRAFT_1170150 [Russula earlei]
MNMNEMTLIALLVALLSSLLILLPSIHGHANLIPFTIQTFCSGRHPPKSGALASKCGCICRRNLGLGETLPAYVGLIHRVNSCEFQRRFDLQNGISPLKHDVGRM